MQGQVIRLPPLDLQSRHVQVIALGAAAAAGFWAGLLYARSSRGVTTTRDAAVNTGAEQAAATLMNGHTSELDAASQASTPRSMVSADGEHTMSRPGSCKMLIIVRTDLLTVRRRRSLCNVPLSLGPCLRSCHNMMPPLGPLSCAPDGV